MVSISKGGLTMIVLYTHVTWYCLDHVLYVAGTNNVLRRTSSNASDMSDSNFELKSSTSYKFNYRAYKKKIASKHDTVTDLFEYDPFQ